jgi:hypothetical protein
MIRLWSWVPRLGQFLAEAPALSARRSLGLAAAGLLVLVCGLFHEAVFEGRALFDRDVHLFWQPQVESFVRVVTTPAWPLWDPDSSFGQPLLADPSAEVLYPPTWLNLLMLPWTYYRLLVVSHLTLSGLGLYLLGRRLGLSGLAAFAGAGVWVSGGPLLSLVNAPHHFVGAAWIPWVLYGAEGCAQDPRARRAVLWGLLATGQILAGSAEMCALAALGCLALVLRHVSWSRLRSNGRLLGCSALAVGLAVMLSAALWVPALDVALRSARRALGQEQRTFWSIHPLALIQTAWPVSWRNVPLSPARAAVLFEGREPFLYSIYLGMPALGLLLAGLSSPAKGVRRALALAGAAALLLALGRHTPFYALAVAALPVLRVFRYPEKAMLLAALCAALLMGLGFDVWRSGRRLAGWRWRVVFPLALLCASGWAGVLALTAGVGRVGPWFVGGDFAEATLGALFSVPVHALLVSSAFTAAVLALALLGPRRSGVTWVPVVVALIAVGDLARAHLDLNPTVSRELFLYRPPALDYIHREDRSRLYAYDYLDDPVACRRYLGRDVPYVVTRAPRGWSPLAAKALAFRDALAPPLAECWGRESSYVIDYRGLYPAFLARLTLFVREQEETPGHLRLLQVGAVSRVVALHTQGLEDLTPLAVIPSPTSEPLRVFAVPQPLPRCYVVAGVRVADGAMALRQLVDPRFDPRRTLILPPGSPSVRASEGPGTDAGECRIERFRPDEVRLAARLSQPAYVVLVDAFDPGWHAEVDGQPAEMLRANVAFRGVHVAAPGAHSIEFKYRPASVLWGAWLSGVTALALATAGLVRARRNHATGSARSGARQAT